MSKSEHKSYDHRLKLLVVEAQEIDVFKNMGIPSSTLSNWSTKGIKNVVTLDEFEMDKIELINALLLADSKNDLLEEKIEILGPYRTHG